MKKIFLIIAVLGCSIAAISQTKFNPTLGPSFSYFSNESDNVDVVGKTGFTAGFNLRFGEQLFFQPGAFYFRSNNTIEEVGNVDISGQRFEFRTEGVRVPLMIGVDLIANERLGIRFYTGPNVAFIFDDEDELIDVDDFLLRDVIWGYNAGVGLDLGIFTVDLNHEWGLSNMFNSDRITSRNNRLFLTVGLLF